MTSSKYGQFTSSAFHKNKNHIFCFCVHCSFGANADAGTLFWRRGGRPVIFADAFFRHYGRFIAGLARGFSGGDFNADDLI